MEPRFVTKDAFTLVGVTATGEPSKLDYADIWNNRYMPIDELLKPYSIDGGYYGATVMEGGQFVYLAGMAVAGLPEIPAGAEAREVPAARYAVFHCSMEKISDTWREAYEQWLPASSYVADEGKADFEYYPPAKEGEQHVEIYIPIRVKEAVGQ